MKNIKLFEEFDADGYKGDLTKFLSWLSSKDFELYDGQEDLEQKFLEVANDDSLAVEDKAVQITNYLEDKWGLYDGYQQVLDYLEKLFMEEV